MNHFDAVEFSECHSEEVKSFFWCAQCMYQLAKIDIVKMYNSFFNWIDLSKLSEYRDYIENSEIKSTCIQ